MTPPPRPSLPHTRRKNRPTLTSLDSPLTRLPIRRPWSTALVVVIVAITGVTIVHAISDKPQVQFPSSRQAPSATGPIAPSNPEPVKTPSTTPATLPKTTAQQQPSARPTPPDTAPAPLTAPIGPRPPPAGDRDTFASTSTVLIRVKAQSQLPQLPDGCEATSLSMLLSAVGVHVDKTTLAKEQPTDPKQPVFATARHDLTRIASWGDPEQNFVGYVTGIYGYSIYHTPLARLLDTKVPGRARDLTGTSFQDVLRQVDDGMPVLMWATTTLRPTDQWVRWEGPNGPVQATFKEHAVLLVGHTSTTLIINNPLTGRRETVDPKPFITAWRQLGRQALTVSPAAR